MTAMLTMNTESYATIRIYISVFVLAAGSFEIGLLLLHDHSAIGHLAGVGVGVGVVLGVVVIVFVVAVLVITIVVLVVVVLLVAVASLLSGTCCC